MPNYHYASTRKGNRKFWTRQVQAYHLSGLSQKEFCQKNGLIYTSFGYWKRRLERSAKAEGIEFVEIDVAAVAENSAAITLSVGKLDIRIHNDANPEMIRWILKELGA